MSNITNTTCSNAGGASAGLFFITTASGMVYVLATTVVMSYPAHLVSKGRAPFSKTFETGMLVAHGTLMLCVQGLFMLASIYGPLSIVLPVYNASIMLWNLPIMYLLGMETFDKATRTATWIVMCAACVLLAVGPQVPEEADTFPDFANPVVIAWLIFLGALWVFTTTVMVLDLRKPDLINNQYVLTALYSVVQGLGTPGLATVGKVSPRRAER